MKKLTVLSNWDKAKNAVALCKSIDEVKVIKDQAEALRSYAKQANEGLEVQNNIADIKLRAERKIGELSKELPALGHRPKASHRGELKSQTLKELGIQHPERYEAIASLPKKEFEQHIKEVKASNKELTTVGVIQLARKLNQPKKREAGKLPEGEFDILYIDPPWHYDFISQSRNAIENHYPTMDLEELKAIKLPSAKNCLMFLWATAPKLNWAMELIKHWGFEYKTCSIWNKERLGMGYWFRINHELLLVGVKGKFSPPDTSVRTSSIYSEKSGKHSKKPDYYYDLIEKQFPDRKYLELFARQKYNDKWTIWGNEV